MGTGGSPITVAEDESLPWVVSLSAVTMAVFRIAPGVTRWSVRMQVAEAPELRVPTFQLHGGVFVPPQSSET